MDFPIVAEILVFCFFWYSSMVLHKNIVFLYSTAFLLKCAENLWFCLGNSMVSVIKYCFAIIFFKYVAVCVCAQSKLSTAG